MPYFDRTDWHEKIETTLFLNLEVQSDGRFFISPSLVVAPFGNYQTILEKPLEIEVPKISLSELLLNHIHKLKQNQQEIRADAEVECIELEKEIQELQALPHLPKDDDEDKIPF